MSALLYFLLFNSNNRVFLGGGYTLVYICMYKMLPPITEGKHKGPQLNQRWSRTPPTEHQQNVSNNGRNNVK